MFRTNALSLSRATGVGVSPWPGGERRPVGSAGPGEELPCRFWSDAELLGQVRLRPVHLIQFAAGRGGDPAPLWARTGVDSQQWSREDVRIPAGRMAEVWRMAIEQTGEPYLALKMGLDQYSAQQTTALIMGE